LLFLIKQFDNFSVKLGAIKEYNKITGRYKEKIKPKEEKEVLDFT
jgi:hypothetical protein